MGKYRPAKRNWCSKCSALVLIDREVVTFLDRVFEHIRCTRCDTEILRNDITVQVNREQGVKGDTIVVPNMAFVRLVEATKVRS